MDDQKELIFVKHALPCTKQEQFSNDVKAAFARRNLYGGEGTPALTSVNVDDIADLVVGPGHIAVLFKDGTISGLSYSEKERAVSPRGASSSSSSAPPPPPPPASGQPSGGAGGGSGGGSHASHVSAVMAANRNKFRRVMLSSSGGRRDRPFGVIVDRNRPLVPASAIPEELIAQAQVVLQGKPREVIVRELQRTNMNVNEAVNNLLSRDDDEEEDEGSAEVCLSEDLLSLLDASAQGVLEADGLYGDSFEYILNRDMRRRGIDKEKEKKKSSGAGAESSGEKTEKVLQCDEQWAPWSGRKFTKMAVTQHALLAVSEEGVLWSWAWTDHQPPTQPDEHALEMLGEAHARIVDLCACASRVAVLLEDGSLSSWLCPGMVGRRASRALACPPAKLQLAEGEKVVQLMCSETIAAARTSVGGFWWCGLYPSNERRKMWEKSRAKTRKHVTFDTNEIKEGSEVRTKSCPIYTAGSVAINMSPHGSMPKIGVLMENVWTLSEMCRFRVLDPSAYDTDVPAAAGGGESTDKDKDVKAIGTGSSRKRRASTDVFSSSPKEEAWPVEEVLFLHEQPANDTAVVKMIDGGIMMVEYVRSQQSMEYATSSSAGVAAAATAGGAQDGAEEKRTTRLRKKEDFVALTPRVKSARSPRIQQTEPLHFVLPSGGGGGQARRVLAAVADENGVRVLCERGRGGRVVVSRLSVRGKLLSEHLLPVHAASLTAAAQAGASAQLALMNHGDDEVLLLRDAWGGVSPLCRDAAMGFREPSAMQLPPLRHTAMSVLREESGTGGGSGGVVAAGASKKGWTSRVCIVACVVSPREGTAERRLPGLVDTVLQCDAEAVKQWLDVAEQDKDGAWLSSEVSSRGDGARNVLHVAAMNAFADKNRHEADTAEAPAGSDADSAADAARALDQRWQRMLRQRPDKNEESAIAKVLMEDASMETGETAASGEAQEAAGLADKKYLVVARPSSDPRARQQAAMDIVRTLLSHPALDKHVEALLQQKDTNGHTPFMCAVNMRAYTAARLIWEAIKKTVGAGVEGAKASSEALLPFIFPAGSRADDSPLFVLCYNDTCSFTWTGEDHINQDIFECRTCGLTGSLCCCTECAMTCHRNHDCKLKRTSPTAYCDCWEKCACKALVAGNQQQREWLLRELLRESELWRAVNGRGEHVLLYLARTVGRQQGEQANWTKRRRPAAAAAAAAASDPSMPEHELEPPRFAGRAMQLCCEEWPVLRSAIAVGEKPLARDVLMSEEQFILGGQMGASHLDKLVFALLSKCPEQHLEAVLSLLIKQFEVFADNPAKLKEIESSAARLARSVCRMFVLAVLVSPAAAATACNGIAPRTSEGRKSALQIHISGYFSILPMKAAGAGGKDAKNKAVSWLVLRCKRVLERLGPLGVYEAVRVADGLLAPIRMGVVRAGCSVQTSGDPIEAMEKFLSSETDVSSMMKTVVGGGGEEGASGAGGGGEKKRRKRFGSRRDTDRDDDDGQGGTGGGGRVDESDGGSESESEGEGEASVRQLNSTIGGPATTGDESSASEGRSPTKRFVLHVDEDGDESMTSISSGDEDDEEEEEEEEEVDGDGEEIESAEGEEREEEEERHDEGDGGEEDMDETVAYGESEGEGVVVGAEVTARTTTGDETTEGEGDEHSEYSGDDDDGIVIRELQDPSGEGESRRDGEVGVGEEGREGGGEADAASEPSSAPTIPIPDPTVSARERDAAARRNRIYREGSSRRGVVSRSHGSSVSRTRPLSIPVRSFAEQQASRRRRETAVSGSSDGGESSANNNAGGRPRAWGDGDDWPIFASSRRNRTAINTSSTASAVASLAAAAASGSSGAAGASATSASATAAGEGGAAGGGATSSSGWRTTTFPETKEEASVARTSAQLATAFCLLIRQVCDVMGGADSSAEGVLSLPGWSSVRVVEAAEARLADSWAWLRVVMDRTEAQIKYGNALTGQAVSHGYQLNADMSRLRSAEPRHKKKKGGGGDKDKEEATAGEEMNTSTQSIPCGVATRRGAIDYLMCAMRGVGGECGDEVPQLEMDALRPAALVVDAYLVWVHAADKARHHTATALGDDDAVVDWSAREADRQTRFFRRSDSLSYPGMSYGHAADTITQRAGDALPLSERPQMLAPDAKPAALFGAALPLRKADEHRRLAGKHGVDDASHMGLARPAPAMSEAMQKEGQEMDTREKVACPEGMLPVTLEQLLSSVRESGQQARLMAMGRWQNTLHVMSAQLCGELQCALGGECVGSPLLTLLSGFVSRQQLFRKRMDRLRATATKDVSLEVHRDPAQLVRDTVYQLNQTLLKRQQTQQTGRGRKEDKRAEGGEKKDEQPILAVHKVKVRFVDEPGEGTGVSRSYYSALAEALPALTSLPFERLGWGGGDEYLYGEHGQAAAAAAVAAGRSSSSRRQAMMSGTAIAFMRRRRRLPLAVSSQVYQPAGGLEPPPPQERRDEMGAVLDELRPVLDMEGDGPIRVHTNVADRIFFKVLAIRQPAAARITGMIVDLPIHQIPMLLNADTLKGYVDDAVDLMMATGMPTDLAMLGENGEAAPAAGVVQGQGDAAPAAARPAEERGGHVDTPTVGSPLPAACQSPAGPQQSDSAPLFVRAGRRHCVVPVSGQLSPIRLSAFRNVGRVMGMALSQCEMLPLQLARHVLKYILDRPVSWLDLAFVDPQMFESLRSLLHSNGELPDASFYEDCALRFEMVIPAEEAGGQSRTVELKPGGSEIDVTRENVVEYVYRYAEARMLGENSACLEALRSGVRDVIPRESLAGLTAEDLRLILCGTETVSFHHMQHYTTLSDESKASQEQVNKFMGWFWWVAERLSAEEKQDLVFFWTGSPSLPSSEEGFQPLPSILVRPPDDAFLPTANTCISRLYLPLYSSKKILKAKLQLAIKAKNFGFV